MRFEKIYDSSGQLTRYDSLLTPCTGETLKCDAIVDFYYRNGHIKERYLMKNQQQNGSYVSYHENGNREIIGYYLNGKENGIFKFYDTAGRYRQTFNTLNGKREGKADVVFNNGLHAYGHFLNDKEDGEWIYQDTLTGKTIYIETYSQGKLIRKRK